MNQVFRDLPLLKKILWADFTLGGGTAVIGLLLYRVLAGFLGLPVNIIIFIAGITLAYGLVALRLALQKTPSVPLLRILVAGNWLWAAISVGLLIIYFADATLFGAIFLVLQVIVVGGLAYLEGRQIR